VGEWVGGGNCKLGSVKNMCRCKFIIRPLCFEFAYMFIASMGNSRGERDPERVYLIETSFNNSLSGLMTFSKIKSFFTFKSCE
jgi:hypothetical protein